MPAQWIRPTGSRSEGPKATSVPVPYVATGQPRLQVSAAQFVSK